MTWSEFVAWVEEAHAQGGEAAERLAELRHASGTRVMLDEELAEWDRLEEWFVTTSLPGPDRAG